MTNDDRDKTKSEVSDPVVLLRCRRHLESENDKKHDGSWYKQCNHCRAAAREYYRKQKSEASRHLEESDPPNRPRKLRRLLPRPISGQDNE
ncbi:hypothetical protein V8E54_011918 [Elaphomyces granulatus]